MNCPEVSPETVVVYQLAPWWLWLLALVGVVLAVRGIYLLAKPRQGSLWRTMNFLLTAVVLVYLAGAMATGAYVGWLAVFLSLFLLVPLTLWRLSSGNLRKRFKAGLEAAKAHPAKDKSPA